MITQINNNSTRYFGQNRIVPVLKDKAGLRKMLPQCSLVGMLQFSFNNRQVAKIRLKGSNQRVLNDL